MEVLNIFSCLLMTQHWVTKPLKDFVNLYKEMKKDKDSKDKITKTENETKSWKDLIDTGEE